MDTEIVQGHDSDCYWVERPDGWWVEVEGLDPRAMARLMIGRKARWVTMIVSPLDDGASQLIYRWDVAGRLLSIATTIADARVDSVADLLPAAAWTEREMHDRFAIEFDGHGESPAPTVQREDGSNLVSCANGPIAATARR